MTNPQYADRNRFYVSLGLILITLAFVLPWLILKEPLELHTSLDELTQLTDISQITIKIRQIAALSLLAISCLASPFLVISGATLVIIGVFRWEKMETVTDQEKIAVSKEKIKEIDEKEKTKIVTMENQMLATFRQALNGLIKEDENLTIEREFNTGKYVFDYLIRFKDNTKPLILIKTKFSSGAWLKYEKIFELFYSISPRSYRHYSKKYNLNMRSVGFMFLPDIHKVSNNNLLISWMRKLFPKVEVQIETITSINTLTINELKSLFYKE